MYCYNWLRHKKIGLLNKHMKTYSQRFEYPIDYLRIGFILALIFYIIFFFTETPLRAQESEPIFIREEPVILAPAGLEEREQADLERQYKYDYRQKGIITEPYISTPFREEPVISPFDRKALTEAEKLYRYFGIASVFYEAGRLEEAKEILEYISLKKPDDQYVKNYLDKINKELKSKKARQYEVDKKEAHLLKKIKIENSLKDGQDYYKQKEFDRALLKFADVLSVDPDNQTAKQYMAKLKEYYLKEVKVEGIIEGWEKRISESEIAGETRPKPKDAFSSEIETSIERMLDEAEFKDEDFTLNEIEETAELLLDEEEMKQLIMNEKADYLLDQAELGFSIEEIISQKMEEEKRIHSFTLGPGDEIQISVREHPELSGKSIIGPEGGIVLPLVNEVVMAKGLLIEDVGALVKEAYKKYVQDPEVYVGAVTLKSKVFYVIDEQGCTPYNITRANFTLRDALFLSDWGSNRALGRVLVMKPHKIHPVIKKVDAFDIVYRGNLSENIRIEDGDVLYVPMTAAAKITQTIKDALSPVKQIKDLRKEWLDMRWNVEDGWYNLPRIPRTQTLEGTYRPSTED